MAPNNNTNMDELTTFNEGLGAGLEIMSKATWRKTFTQDGRDFNDWPPHGKWIIGLYRQKRKDAAPWKAELVMCVMDRSGFDVFQRGEQDFKAPDYWVELPDPNDFA